MGLWVTPYPLQGKPLGVYTVNRPDFPLGEITYWAMGNYLLTLRVYP